MHTEILPNRLRIASSLIISTIDLAVSAMVNAVGIRKWNQ